MERGNRTQPSSLKFPRSYTPATATSNPNPALSLRLTQREIDVLRAMAQDMTLKEIALRLGMSRGRVDEHVAELKHRLGVRTTHGVVLRGVEGGFLEPGVFPPTRHG